MEFKSLLSFFLKKGLLLLALSYINKSEMHFNLLYNNETRSLLLKFTKNTTINFTKNSQEHREYLNR